MIMPFIVMLLAFGFSRTVNLFVDLQAEYIDWSYNEHQAFEYSLSEWENGIELDGMVYPTNATNTELEWECVDQDTFDGSELDPENPIARIEDGRLYMNKKGIVKITAKVKNSGISKEFTAYLTESNEYSTTPEFVILLGEDKGESGIRPNAFRHFGLYDLADGQKALGSETFTAMVFPSSAASREVEVSIEGGDGIAQASSAFDEESGLCSITVNMQAESRGRFVTLKASAKGTQVNATCMFMVVDGINVRSYDDLMYCTSEEHPEKVVLRTNLESSENVKTRRNSALFGRRQGDKVVCDYTTIKSTYDVTFYKNRGMDADAVVNVGVTFRDDVFGNGYTINAHELCYPSQTYGADNIASLGKEDVFRGPLQFVEDLTCACYGQDSIGFMIKGDGITVDNIMLKNCNNVSNLSNLDYVGTVVEVDGDDVSIINSQIMNGRTVVRSMSNKRLVIEACVLSHAREFILKIGSNKFVYPESGLDVSSLEKEAMFNILAPEVDEYGMELKGNFDSTATVKNTYFTTSGIFCVGMDAHFAGELLYNRSEKVRNLAATSYPSKLTLEGDVRFYDWKTVDGLDSTTLISTGADYSDLFQISEIIRTYNKIYLQENPDKKMVLEKDNVQYVHGGVAFFGGGKNFSEVDFSGVEGVGRDAFRDLSAPLEIGLDDSRLGFSNNILVRAAGYGKFKFYMYNPDYTGITAGSILNVKDMQQYAILQPSV